MARNYAALPHDYLEEMELLTDAEFGRLCRALLKYSSTGEMEELSGGERVLFPRVKMQEDRFQASYEEQAALLSSRGKAGAKARWDNAKACQSMQENAKACLSMPSNAKYGNTKTETETETKRKSPSGEGDARARRFVPPTVEDVAGYVREIGCAVDPERFVDFYASKGWMVGKTRMKDWKAAVRNWARDSRKKPQDDLLDMIERGEFRDAGGNSEDYLDFAGVLPEGRNRHHDPGEG